MVLQIKLVCRPLQVFLMGKLAEKKYHWMSNTAWRTGKLGFTAFILFPVRFKFSLWENLLKKISLDVEYGESDGKTGFTDLIWFAVRGWQERLCLTA